jgi:hypothetical protein
MTVVENHQRRLKTTALRRLSRGAVEIFPSQNTDNNGLTFQAVWVRPLAIGLQYPAVSLWDFGVGRLRGGL